ncbi:GIY-YIG nuclease family protein [Aeromonas simiae]|uniref:GIY-YIG nuclease family protein n=1 Tax=Aeromonas simiae TaxID=218936 RepID=UPI000ADA35E3|nr:GIY-YIG nuclease family protein [Aeromonas simiae]
MSWHLYLVRTARGHLYAGISTDPQRRLAEHQSGRGARSLRGKGPLTLVWQAEVGEHGEALRLEYRLKRLTKAAKEQLVATPQQWPELRAHLLPEASEP